MIEEFREQMGILPNIIDGIKENSLALCDYVRKMWKDSSSVKLINAKLRLQNKILVYGQSILGQNIYYD